MSSDPRIQQVIQLIRDGKKGDALVLVSGLLRERPNDADLLYFAAAASSGDERIAYLRRALAVNPNHARSQAMLDKLVPATPATPFAQQPVAPMVSVTSKRKSNLPLQLAVGAIVLMLIAASGFGGYQIGHDAGLHSLANTMVVAFYGNEASQTAYPLRMATIDAESTVQRASYGETATAMYAAYTAEAKAGDATRSAIESLFGGTSTAMYAEATQKAEALFATQTAAAPKLVSSISEVVLTPGDYITANWRIEVEVSPLDDKTESSARLSSDGTDIYNSSSFTIECKKSEFTVHFSLDSVFTFGDQEIQIRLDKEPVRILKPMEYTGSSFIGLASPRAFLKSIVGHDQLVIAVGEFAPVTFTITNVDVASTFPLKACGF